MRSTKIAFWAATTFIFLFEGVMPALTFNTELAKEGVRHLGYPEYFGGLLVICKILGCLILILPMIGSKVKEWAYAGFTFNFLFAAASHSIVDGADIQSIFPLFILSILIVSYFSYHKLQEHAHSVRGSI